MPASTLPPPHLLGFDDGSEDLRLHLLHHLTLTLLLVTVIVIITIHLHTRTYTHRARERGRKEKCVSPEREEVGKGVAEGCSGRV